MTAFGSLFAAMDAPHALDTRYGFATVLAVQLAATVVIGLLALRLPDPRPAAR